MDRSGVGEPGLMDRLAALSAAIVRMLHTRIELAGAELAIERDFLMDRAASAVTCVIAAGLAGFAAILLAALALPERYRLVALATLVVVFGAIAIGAWLRGRRQWAGRTSLFTRLSRQLRQDRAVLDGFGSPPSRRDAP